MSKIIRWNTPFTDEQYPAVEFLTTIELGKHNALRVLVAPSGVDKYPKYLINFGEVIAFTCMEEAHAPQLIFDSELEPEIEPRLSAYQYLDSPWLKSYEPQIHFIPSGHLGYLSHYLIYGGDNNVEVITPYEPSIQRIEQKRLFKIEREL
jgi:hypothetical protein